MKGLKTNEEMKRVLRNNADVSWIEAMVAGFNKTKERNSVSKNAKDIMTANLGDVILKYDFKNEFASIFHPNTGAYARSGVIAANENGECYDSEVDSFMTEFPELIDVGIMQTCVCAKKCNVDCYQKAIDRSGENMSLENFKRIVDECKGKTFQFALGGAGDVDTHEDFEEMLRVCREAGIIPNFTTSGITMTKKKAEICKKYCGAIAVSEHFAEYTNKAIDMLLEAGVKTNIHYVLSNKTIDDAINKLKNGGFKKGINAVVFLLYKNVGLGKTENILSTSDERVKEFFKLVDRGGYDFKIGFDSCTVPAVLNFTHNVLRESVDTCEGGRWSCYITADMKMLPCSFDNQELRWAVDISEGKSSIAEAWKSKEFEEFRGHFRQSCGKCKMRKECMGGCPIRREIVLCNREEKDLR